VEVENDFASCILLLQSVNGTKESLFSAYTILGNSFSSHFRIADLILAHARMRVYGIFTYNISRAGRKAQTLFLYLKKFTDHYGPSAGRVLTEESSQLTTGNSKFIPPLPSANIMHSKYSNQNLPESYSS